MPNNQTEQPVTVEQAARIAYVAYIRRKNGDDTDLGALNALMTGDWDSHHGVQIALLGINEGLRLAAEECRSMSKTCVGHNAMDLAEACDDCATAIEALMKGEGK